MARSKELLLDCHLRVFGSKPDLLKIERHFRVQRTRSNYFICFVFIYCKRCLNIWPKIKVSKYNVLVEVEMHVSHMTAKLPNKICSKLLLWIPLMKLQLKCKLQCATFILYYLQDTLCLAISNCTATIDK
jgi:hypothetical protein